MKNPWQKPQLLVLARGNPEEAVLTACKTFTTTSGMTSWNYKCDMYLTETMCTSCAQVLPS